MFLTISSINYEQTQKNFGIPWGVKIHVLTIYLLITSVQYSVFPLSVLTSRLACQNANLACWRPVNSDLQPIEMNI